MYTIIRTKQFEKSYSKLKRSGMLKQVTISKLVMVIDVLATGKQKLPLNLRDHALVGDLAGYRECHLQGDLLLVYKIEKEELLLILVDIGSHSYLF